MKSVFFAAASGVVLLAVSGAPAQADEGMWTFDNFPAAKVKSAYGVDIDQAWLDRVRGASIRLTNGCSASVVSPEGLVLTNHHCVVDCVQALSSGEKDYVQDGFLTDSREEELKCPGQQAEILAEIVDVTQTVQAAGAGLTGQAFNRARDASVAQIEQEACANDAGYRCQVVSLYRGGQYKLYKYRRYDDVRLVFAPEFATAFFGGDPDNFNFPRFNLDMAFLRLYEGDQPAVTPDHLTWTARAPQEGEPTFVSGNPGSTSRLLTVAQLESQRDLAIPVGQLQRSELRGRLIQFSQQGVEEKRIATDPLFGVENSFKVFFGRQFALNDPSFMAAKRAAEAELKQRVLANRALTREIGDPWGEIEAAQAAYAEQYMAYRQIEAVAGGGSSLYGYARTLVRAAQERNKPNGERLSEFTEARLPLLEKRLLDVRPVDRPLEELYLAFWLSKTREYLTTDDPATQLLLGRESPEAMAARLAAGSRLDDPAVRKALWEGGQAAIEASNDPMIQLALRMDSTARGLREAWETEVEAPTARAAERIARARFAVYGDQVYPDATFTLRLSYGQVQGWTHRGRTIPAATTLAGLYERATGAEPYALAPAWAAAKDDLDLSITYNFVTTNDIIGGNSGSPVVNAQGEVLGAAFDGNIHSLGGDYGYDGALNRTVVVSTAAATEAMRKIYRRDALLAELGVR
ncbi:S46 family peptidase [Phenylobacterium sp.]|uniref:S46 family peptidase n=1 Tax=Phenylobacterium sp. TaxID=1871053 RepID=UPI002FDA2F78